MVIPSVDPENLYVNFELSNGTTSNMPFNVKCTKWSKATTAQDSKIRFYRGPSPDSGHTRRSLLSFLGAHFTNFSLLIPWKKRHATSCFYRRLLRSPKSRPLKPFCCVIKKWSLTVEQLDANYTWTKTKLRPRITPILRVALPANVSVLVRSWFQLNSVGFCCFQISVWIKIKGGTYRKSAVLTIQRTWIPQKR